MQAATPATTPFERNPGVETQESYTTQGHTPKESNALESKEYEYNAAERLIRYASTEQGQSEPQIEASYRHDPFGRRIAKTVRQGQNSRTTYYIYSEQGLMAEADEKGQMTKAYGFNPTTMQLGLWSTDPIWQAETPNGSLTDPKARYDWLHTDHLGTPILATTKEGRTSWRAVSESFGATLPIDQDIEMNLRFPGQYFDAETGTHYNFHRDYRPNAGRYLQGDPIGLEGGVNAYGYSGSSPILMTDSRGLDYWVEGSVQGEGGHPWHRSVCVGKHNGKRLCISFGVIEDCLMQCKGMIYEDISAAGPLVDDMYQSTSMEEDAEIGSYFISLVGERGRYSVIGSSCRDFSLRIYNELYMKYNVKKRLKELIERNRK